MKVVFHLLIISLIFVACQERQVIKTIDRSDYLTLVDSIDLEFDYIENQAYITFTFSIDGLNYFAFYRGIRASNISEQIDIFSEDGIFHKKIVLDTLDYVYESTGRSMPTIIDFVSPSKFFMLIGSALYQFDGDGNIVWSKDFEYLKEELDCIGFYHHPYAELFMTGDTSIQLNILDYYDNNDGVRRDCEQRVELNEKFQKEPKMLIIENIFADSLRYKAVLNDVYEGVIDSMHTQRRPRSNHYYRGRFFCWLEHSNILRVYDDDLNLVDELIVESDSVKVGVEASRLCDTLNIHDFFMDQVKNAVVIEHAFYSKKAELYLIQTNSAMNKLVNNFPSFFIYNTEGEKLEELYAPQGVWVKFRQCGDKFYHVRMGKRKLYIYDLHK